MVPAADEMKGILENNKNIVVLSGLNVMHETGLNGIRAEHIAYEIEEKYGYSNDEIISSAFFSRRGDIFFDYYRNIILNIDDPQPTLVHKAICQMQEDGKVDAVITRTTYELYQKAGCKNVLSMHGTVEENICPSCGRLFGMKYIKASSGVPVCDECKVPLRPGFNLLGERVDNGKMTRGCNLVENANVLLVLGASVRSPLCQYVVNYYTGNKMILINTSEEMGDERADYRLYGKLSELVPYVTGYEADRKKKEEAGTNGSQEPEAEKTEHQDKMD